MIMKIAGLILALLTALPMTARTAADFFAKAPLEAVPVLTPNARLDMLDYFHSGVETATANTLGGKSRIIAEEPMKLRAEISKSSELQVAVLPNKGDTIVAFIETVASPVKDSYVTFYRASDWKRLPDPKLPDLNSFIPAKNRAATGTTEMPAIFFITIDYDPAQELFLIYNTSFDNLPKGEHPDAAKLTDSLQAYRYNGSKLVRVKDFKETIEIPGSNVE